MGECRDVGGFGIKIGSEKGVVIGKVDKFLSSNEEKLVRGGGSFFLGVPVSMPINVDNVQGK